MAEEALLKRLERHPVREYREGASILEVGGQAGVLLFLKEGSVRVLKGEVEVAVVKEPGSVLGELSALLGTGHAASVVAATDCALYVVEDPEAFLREEPEVLLHVARLLARRTTQMIDYLADVKGQFQEHEHLGMIDQVLDTLVHRPPRAREKGPMGQ